MSRQIALTIVGLVLVSTGNIRAQSYTEEALILSRVRVGGTARIQAMGGVQNALGGDISSAFYNPAGLGMFNRSDLSLTPAYQVTSYSSTYLGNKSSNTDNSIIIPNAGVAFHTGQDGSKGIWGGTFGINFNRINDFNETFTYTGTNPDNSIIDYFISDANGTNTSQFDADGFNYNSPTGLAFFNYLIGPQDILTPPGPEDEYFTDVTGIPDQAEVVQNSGSQNQWSISYGLNFNDKIFLGGGIGITTIKYRSEKTYTETFADPAQPMSRMELKETITLEGGGINATAGIIYRPMDQIQLGFSAATPTTYEINDNYNASMTSSWKSFEYQPGEILTEESASTDNLSSTYNLITPWRLSLGATYFFQKRGLLSADVEWLNYNNTRYDGDDNYTADNEQIKNTFKSTFNIRVGSEYRIGKYRIRGGYNLMPDPFQVPQNGVDRLMQSLSAGGGYRTEKFYIDLAVVYSSGDLSYRPYQLNYSLDPLVTQRKQATAILVTIGLPF